MTTKVLIVNLGPDPIEVSVANEGYSAHAIETLYQHGTTTAYVHDIKKIMVREKKPEKEGNPT